jgi:hypothetical protein
MTIGPAPMMRIEEMSVRLGIASASVIRHSGARALAREPGIHIHQWWLWIPGPAFGRPGMTGTHKKRARFLRAGAGARPRASGL